ncbi:MAG: hypothetical protein WCJ63_09230, partial [Actinomycetes bacterium]
RLAGSSSPRKTQRVLIFGGAGIAAFLIGSLIAITMMGSSPSNGSLRSGPIGADPVITADGINSVRVGMTLEAASRAAGWPLKSGYYSPSGDAGQGCGTASLDGGPQSVNFMIAYDKIKSVSVYKGSGDIAATAHSQEGIRLGDPMSKVREKYAGKYVERPDEYVRETPKLEVTTNEASTATGNVLLFGGDKQGRVVSISGGQKTWVELAEGCL